MYDFIGDIHGYGLHLEALLLKLGYERINGVYKHPERKVFFLGDYIDRGPEIELTLKIVRSMVEEGHALAIMGNHEYNALCFETKHEGAYLRPHNPGTINQYQATLHQFARKKDAYQSYLNWFYTLPLFYEDSTFNAVHACWDSKAINVLKSALNDNRLSHEKLINSCQKGTDLNDAVEVALKGKELELPSGHHFFDKDGKKRHHIRFKWWENPDGKTYGEAAIPKQAHLNDINVQLDPETLSEVYPAVHKPVFFGHYWLKGEPMIQKSNVCCLDFSIAKKGYLAAYRFNGEGQLDNQQIVYV